MPRVSIITPFLNAENFLEEAIESVFSQTCEDWELILVDDGSDDRSSEIAKLKSKKFPEKVIYLEHSAHRNLGKSVSRNLGIRNARGEFTAFLDADDCFLPEKLERQISILENQPEAAMVYGPSLYWHSWSGQPEDLPKDCLAKLGVAPGTSFAPPALLIKFLEDSGTVPCICGLLARTETLREVNGFEESFSDMFEDQTLLAKICLNYPVYVDSGCYDKYRQHSDSSSHKAIQQGYYHPLKPNPAQYGYLKWLEDFISKHKQTDKTLYRNLEKSLKVYRKSPVGKINLLLKNTMIWLQTDFFHGLRMNLTAPVKRRLKPAILDSFRSVIPVSYAYGYDRGLPVDRYYVEKFLEENSLDILGQVLEVGDNYYTQKYGEKRVTISDVLHVSPGNPKATLVGDLSNADHLPSHAFDTIILTQTLQLIYDLKSTVRTLHRILKKGGILLVTVPGISPIDRGEWGKSWFWSFTDASIRRLFEEFFPPESLRVETHGNVLAAVAFLHGLAKEELRREELDYHDPAYQVVITMRAVKSN